MSGCYKLLDPNQRPIVYIKDSLIANAGKGLFAKQFIKKDNPVVIYFGDIFISWKK